MEKAVNKCSSCGNEMRVWELGEGPGVKTVTGMCITEGCQEQGKLYRVLEYVPEIVMNFKVDIYE